MKYLAIVFLIVSLSLSSWGAAWTATNTSGATDFNTNNTWGGTGHPVVGDSFTIPTGKTVVCNGVCAAGLSTAGAGSADCVIQQGGTLTISPGATLNCSGNIENDKGSTFNVTSTCGNIATVNQIVPNAGTYKFTFPNTGSGTSTLTYTGTAPVGARCDALFTCTQTGTGTCSYAPTSNADIADNFNYVMFKNFGSSSVTAITEPVTTARDINWNRVYFINSGTINVSRTSATVNWHVSHVVAINPLTQANYMIFNDTTAPTSGVRNFDNLRVYSENPAVFGQIQVNVRNAIVGQSVEAGDPADIEGFVCYGCQYNNIGAASINVRTNNSMLVIDNVLAGIPVAMLQDGAQTLWNVMTFGISANWKPFSPAGANAGIGPTVMQHPMCDGDGQAQNDYGDMLELTSSGSTAVAYRPVNLNNCGTTITAQTGSFKALNGTMYRSNGGSIDETACISTALTEWHNHIMVWPLDFINTNFGTGAYGGGDGLHTNQAYNTASCQLTWGANTMGNNAYFMMPNTGDVLNGNAAESLNNANGANANVPQAPYFNAIKSTAGGLTGLANVVSTAGTTTTHISCSTCDFVTAGVQPGSEVVGFTTAPNPRSVVLTVNDLHNVDLRFPIPALVVGEQFSIAPSTYSNPAFYLGDSNNLQGDIHVDPFMRNPDQATVCYWLKLNGETVHCGTRVAGQYYNSTTGPHLLAAGSGPTTLICSACDFVGWNVQVGESLEVYSGNSTTERGTGTVVSRNSATSLTITSITGTTTNDHLIFTDVTRAAGRAMLTQENLDQNGNYVAIKPWATLMNLRQYLDWNLTPMNGQLKNASFAANCTADPLLCDIGAETVFNAASF